MAESPKRPIEISPANASREFQPVRPVGTPSAETARAADSVPAPIGPFATLPMKFGRYEIRKELGRGQMGAVYLAKDVELDRLVALKVARTSASGSAKLLKRMEIEAKSAAKVDHPLICKVYDAGEIDGIRFIALQYIEGEDLKKYMKRVGRKLEPTEAVRLVLQILRALEAAHEKGIIHRDLKPENVMLNKKREPVIMDFGLARHTIGSANAGLTQGMIVGTAAYMSPEQATGKAEEIDHRSDLYAVGVMLFEMLTGEWPFTGGAIEVMGKKCVQEPPSPLSLNSSVNPQLATVCYKMIAKQKNDRYLTCVEVIEAIETINLNAPSPIEADVDAVNTASTLPLFDFPIETSATLASRKRLTSSGDKKSLRQRLLSGLLKLLSTWWNAATPVQLWSAVGGMGSCLILLTTVMFFQKGDAVVRVEIHDDNVEVTFQKETITLADGAHEFKVRPGAQTLHIKSGNIEFDTDKFTLKQGKNPAVTVEIVKSEIVTKLGDQEIGRRSVSVSSTGQSGATRKSVGKLKAAWQGWPADAPPPAIAPFDAEQAKKHQDAWAAYLKIPVEYTNSIGMKFRLIPPGEFLMGSTPEEVEQQVTSLEARGQGAWANVTRSSAPQHTVVLTQPNYFCIHEVSQDQYKKLTGTNPSHFAATGGGKTSVAGLDTSNHPVETLSWEDSTEACTRLSLRENLKPFDFRNRDSFEQTDGTGYRLPTEAEWEFACRAGTTSTFWSGSKREDWEPVAWFGPNSGGHTHAVGELKPNAFGLFDIHGNVAEFVADGWQPDFYSGFLRTPAIDPIAPFTRGSRRVHRGGAWGFSLATGGSSSNRRAYDLSIVDLGVGFRMSLPVSGVKVALAAAAPFNAAQAKNQQPDPFQTKSVWVNEPLKLKTVLTVIERKDQMFKARLEVGDVIDRELTGSIQGDKVSWLAKDVLAATGTTGGDNHGTISSDKEGHKIEFVWRDDRGVSGAFTLRLSNVNSIAVAKASPTASSGSKSLSPATVLNRDPVGKTPGEVRELIPGIKFHWCPPGDFMMGESSSSAKVTLSSGFWLGETEVTQGQWEGLMKSTPWKGKKYMKENADCAASYICHDDAIAFVKKLTEQERAAGRLPAEWKYALPTEAQWEYACRSGTNTAYSFGDESQRLSDYGWWGGLFGDGNAKTEQYAHEVGLKKPNAWGFRDMHGNVWEWCADWYGEKLPGGTDPLGPSSGSHRLNRGGGWSIGASSCQSAGRGQFSPGHQDLGFGFRVVAERILSPTEPALSNGKTPGEARELTPGIKFHWCPPGDFTMGESSWSVNVTLTQGFWLGETEVTQGQWEVLMKSTPWKGKEYVKENVDCAATYISHDHAIEFVKKLTEQERAAGRLPAGWKYALPTEAQWEYACRSGTNTAYSFGDESQRLSDYGWWGGSFAGDGNSKTEQYAHEVGLKKPNAWGFRDMHGNAWEWCADWYGENLPGGTDPLGSSSGSARVGRGGSWYFVASRCRSVTRGNRTPDNRDYHMGFRVAGVRSGQ